MAMSLNKDFTKMVTGSRKGEIFFTDITKSIYSRLDNLKDECILSLAVSNDAQYIYATTSKNKLIEYVIVNWFQKFKKNIIMQRKKSIAHLYNKECSLFKEIHLNTSFLCGTKVEFNDEITKFYIMKNKIYIITENLKKKVSIIILILSHYRYTPFIFAFSTFSISGKVKFVSNVLMSCT